MENITVRIPMPNSRIMIRDAFGPDRPTVWGGFGHIINSANENGFEYEWRGEELAVWWDSRPHNESPTIFYKDKVADLRWTVDELAGNIKNLMITCLQECYAEGFREYHAEDS